MICDDCRQDLGAYLDGELDDARRREVDEHLGGCENCRGELETLRKLTGILRDAPRAKAPAGLAQKIAADARRPKILRIGVWLPSVAVAAAVLLAAVIGLSGGRSESNPRRSPGEAAEGAAIAAKYAVAAPVTVAAAPPMPAAAEPMSVASMEAGTDAGGRRYEIAKADDAAKTKAPDASSPAPSAETAAAVGAATPAALARKELPREAPADTSPELERDESDTLVGRRLEMRDRRTPARPQERQSDLGAAPAGAERQALDRVAIPPDAEEARGAVTASGGAAVEKRADGAAATARPAAPATSNPETFVAAKGGRGAASDPVLYVERMVADTAAERSRVERLAASFGGEVVRGGADLVAEMKAALDARARGAAAGERVAVRVPSREAVAFLAELERLSVEGGVEGPAPIAGAQAGADAGTDADIEESDSDDIRAQSEGAQGDAPTAVQARVAATREVGIAPWTRVEIHIGQEAPAAARGAEAGRPDDQQAAQRRFEELLGTRASAEVSKTAPSTGVAVSSAIRVHLVPFRGDVAGEALRVQKLALYYGGRVIVGVPLRQTPDEMMRQHAQPLDRQMLRFSMPAEVAAEFVEAARLNDQAPPGTYRSRGRADAADADRAPQPLEQRAPPQRWVTVEVTIGAELPATPQR